jgi:hypothetical protein
MSKGKNTYRMGHAVTRMNVERTECQKNIIPMVRLG